MRHINAIKVPLGYPGISHMPHAEPVVFSYNDTEILGKLARVRTFYLKLVEIITYIICLEFRKLYFIYGCI